MYVIAENSSLMPCIFYNETNVVLLCKIDSSGNVLPGNCFD